MDSRLPNGIWILVNRIVPGLSVTILLGLAGWQLSVALAPPPEIAPVPVPRGELPGLPAREVVWPARNLFAADGAAWVLDGATASTVAGAGTAVVGVINLPGGPKGVMVGSRFVPLGEIVAGGWLRDVRENAYVVEIDGREQTRPLDAGRAERISRLLKRRDKTR